MNSKIRYRHPVPVMRSHRRISLVFEIAIGLLVLGYAGYNVWTLDQIKAQVETAGLSHAG